MFTVFFLCSTGIFFAQDSSQKIKDLMDKYHEYEVLVANDGKEIFADGCEMVIMEYDILNRPETKPRIGSITRQFTAARPTTSYASCLLFLMS